MKQFLIVVLFLVLTSPVLAGYDRDFEAGSLIVPMDLTYQDHGMFQAYGMLFHLLKNGITVYWVIDENKTWHHASCDTAGDECTWDCAEEGSGAKCPYPTASPDFYAAAQVIWDGEGQMSPGDPINDHGYRGGPFVIDSADKDAALVIINVWNDPATWVANPWADRTVFQVVSVHEATAAFSGYVRKEMVAAPTIAVFADGNEDIATNYLRAAGIPQSNGNEFPQAKCGAANCGPGTDNPDMLTVPSIMGDMGTCDNPNYDHKNGALFTEDGIPAYCQIMTMHWDVRDREKVECNGGACPATQAECSGEMFTYHGHEVVAEVREFLQYPVHFFAECQGVNAYENTVPNPDWPYLDDSGRLGHYLTTTGTPPDCANDADCDSPETDYECIPQACDNRTRDCCQPSGDKEKGAGFLIADQPNQDTIKVLFPEIPYNQFDGKFGTVGGSEPAYNLSTFLQTTYKNDLEIVFITGPNGPGNQDVWMSGFIDGECWIGYQSPVDCYMGKISFLGGHAYKTDLPLSTNEDSQGTRLFLNALFEADCVTDQAQPDVDLSLVGDVVVAASSLPVESTYTAGYNNTGLGFPLDAVLSLELPANTSATEFETPGTETNNILSWIIGSIGAVPQRPGDPSTSGSRWATVEFPATGTYPLNVGLEYRVGVSTHRVGPFILNVEVKTDTDGDGVADDVDPHPNDPFACGDSDGDTCDDCSVAGSFAPDNDGPDSDGDGLCDAGDPDLDGGDQDGGVTDGGDAGGGDTGGGDQTGSGKSSGCDCASSPSTTSPLLFLGLIFSLLVYRRRQYT